MAIKKNKFGQLMFVLVFFASGVDARASGCERVQSSTFSSGLHALADEAVTAIIIEHADKDREKGVHDRDVPITPEGRIQASEIGKALQRFWREKGFSYSLLIAHSNFVRTTQTAQEMEAMFSDLGDLKAKLESLPKIIGGDVNEGRMLLDWIKERSRVSRIQVYIEHSGGINSLLRSLSSSGAPDVDYAESVIFKMQDGVPVCIARVQWSNWSGMALSDQ